MAKEDLLWRLLTANFMLLAGIVCLLLAYMIFRNGPMAAVCVYTAFGLSGWGIVRGLFAIIDRNRAEKSEE